MIAAPMHAVYTMVDEYTAQSDAGMPEDVVTADERESLARYFQQMVTRLMKGEGIDAATQSRLASECGVEGWRVDDIATFLNEWGRD